MTQTEGMDYTSEGPTVGERRAEGEAAWKGRNMAKKMRYNKIIDLLEHGKPVFSTSTSLTAVWMT